MRKIDPWKTLLAGVAATALLVFSLAPLWSSLLNSLVPLRHSFLFYTLPIAAIIVAGFFVGRLDKVEAFHEGVPYLFGTPKDGIIFTHGWHWLPPFVSFKLVDMRRLSKEIKDVETFTKGPNQAHLTFKSVTFEFRVKNPYRFLGIKPEDLDQNFRGLAEQVLRLVVSQKTLEEALEMGDEANRVLHLVGCAGQTPDAERHQYKISDELDVAASEWGVDVVNTFISEPCLDQEVAHDLQGAQKEALQRKKEEVEVAHAINMLNKLNGEPITISVERRDPRTGRIVVEDKTFQLAEKMSAEAAALFFQTAQGDKLKREVHDKRIIIPEESISALAQIGIIISSALGGKEKG